MTEEFSLDTLHSGTDRRVQLISSAFDGAFHLVAWTGPYGVRAARYDREGTLLDAVPLTIVPHGLLRGSALKVTPRSTGGFLVMWQGPLFTDDLDNTAAENEFGLYVAVVERNGTVLPYQNYEPHLESFSITLLGPADDIAREQWVKTVTSVPALNLVALRTFAITERTGEVRDAQGPPGVATSVSVPGLLSPAHVVRLNDRLYLATVAKTNTGTALEVRALTSVGTGHSTDNGILVFSTPFTRNEQRPSEYRDFALTVVDDQVVLAWRSGTDQVLVKAASILPRADNSFEVSAVVTLGDSEESLTPEHFETFAVGHQLLVPIRTNTDFHKMPLSMILDVKTMVASPGIQTELSQSNQPYFEGALRGCSFDGEACLAVVHYGYGVFAKRVLTNGFFPAETDLASVPALPGTPAQQKSPRAVCGAETCLVAWTDEYEYDLPDSNWRRGTLVDKATGLPVSERSFPIPSVLDDNQAIVATAGGFVVAQTQCPKVGGPTQLLVRTVSERGEWTEAKTLTFDDISCSDFSQIATTVATNGIWFAVHVVSSSAPVGLAILNTHGTLERRPLTLSQQWYEHVEMVALKDHVMMALSNLTSVTTALLSLDSSGVSDQIFAPEVCSRDCTWANRKLIVLPGHDNASLLALTYDSYDHWALKLAHLDAQGRPAEFRTLTEGRGTIMNLQSGIDAVTDEAGLSVLLAQRDWRSDPFRVVFYHFDFSGDEPKASPARTVATDIMLPAQALAYAGNGQWLTAFCRTDMRSLASYVLTSDSRVNARFLYGPLTSTDN